MQAVKTERLLQTLLVLATAALGFYFWDATTVRIINVGDDAPHFEIRTDSGILLSPTNFGGKLLLVNFWATWCPPCVQEVPSLEALHKMFKDSGVVVLGISLDRNEAKYRSFLKRFGVTYQTAREADTKIPVSYGTFRYPETYVIDRNGKVIQKIISNTNFTDEAMVRFIKSQL